MGWWSESIMGGDEPLDLQSVIYRFCGKEQFPDDSDNEYKLTAKDFNDNPNIYQDIIGFKDRDGKDLDIEKQVFAYMIMEAGGIMSDLIRFKTTQACDNDEWAHGAAQNCWSCDWSAFW